MRCTVIRGDAWLVLLSPCNTYVQQPGIVAQKGSYWTTPTAWSWNGSGIPEFELAAHRNVHMRTAHRRPPVLTLAATELSTWPTVHQHHGHMHVHRLEALTPAFTVLMGRRTSVNIVKDDSDKDDTGVNPVIACCSIRYATRQRCGMQDPSSDPAGSCKVGSGKGDLRTDWQRLADTRPVALES